MDEEFTKCSICLEDYNKTDRIPRQLTCQHSFCSPCLSQVYGADRYNVTCPTCRQKLRIKYDDVPKSRLILNYLDMMGPRGAPGTSQPPYPSNTSTHYTSSSQTKPNAPYSQDTQRSYQPAPVTSIPTYVDYSISSQTNNPYNNYPRQDEYSNQPQGNQEWDSSHHLRQSFDVMDIDRNGYISFEELYNALRDGQPSEFHRETVKLLLNKYDSDRDYKISFEEFKNLFIGINNQYNEFLDIDQDFSGSIEMSEMKSYFRTKGFNFPDRFYIFLIDSIASRTGSRSINFDIYLKLRARFDQLNAEYQRNRVNDDKETYFGRNFFQKF